MARPRRDAFSAVRSEGGLLPSDFLRQVAEGSKSVPGLTPEAYHPAGNEKLNETASRSWNRALGAWAAFQVAAANLEESDTGTAPPRGKELLPLFQELG